MGKIYAPNSISLEVLNIIKAIVNVLHIVIKKNQSIYEHQEVLIVHCSTKFHPDKHSFTAFDFFPPPNQQGTQGQCKTKYNIDEDVKTKHLLVTKTRDLSQCQKRIFKNIGLSYMQKCPECVDVSVNLSNARL